MTNRRLDTTQQPDDARMSTTRAGRLAALALGLAAYVAPQMASADCPAKTAKDVKEQISTLSPAEREKLKEEICRNDGSNNPSAPTPAPEPPKKDEPKTGEKPVVDAVEASYDDQEPMQPRNAEGPQPEGPSTAKVVIRYGADQSTVAKANPNGDNSDTKALAIWDLELGVDYGGVPERPAYPYAPTRLKPTNTTPIHGGFGYAKLSIASAKLPWLGGYLRLGAGADRAYWNPTPNNNRPRFAFDAGIGLDMHFRRDKVVQPVFSGGLNVVRGFGVDVCGGVEWGIAPNKFGIKTSVCYANNDRGEGGATQGVVEDIEYNGMRIRTNEVHGQVALVFHGLIERIITGKK